MKTCPCSNPPGGTIQCADHQLAICGSRNGQIVAGCFDPPPSVERTASPLDRALILSNWTLSMVTGVARQDLQTITPEDQAILASGSFKSVSGDEIKFVAAGAASASAGHA